MLGKQTNINEHEFEDGDIINACPSMGGRLFLNFADGGHVQLCEKDAIAIVNHWGHFTHSVIHEDPVDNNL